MKNRLVISVILIFIFAIPLFGQQAQFVALMVSDKSNKKTNDVTKISSITNEVSCEGITVEGLIGDVGWIKNTGNTQRRVRVVSQYLNPHNAGSELTISMSLLGPGEKIRVYMVSANTAFYIYSLEGGLLGFMKTDKLSKKESGWFN